MKKHYLVSAQPGVDLAGLTEQLRRAGVDVAETLDAIGVINVTAEKDAVQKVRKMRGVAAVEESGEVHLPPPDSDVQ